MNTILYTAPGGSRHTVREAARKSRSRALPLMYSHFFSEVRGRNGRLKHRSEWRHNLTTDSATGYTNRRDWQSKAMGGGLYMFYGSSASGNATATSASSLTASGSFPTASQGLAGSIVAAGPNASGVGSVGWGVIVSNTSTVLTIDQWYNPGTGAALGTPPNATASYQILPGQFAAPYLAVTANTFTPLSSDTTLAGELTSNGFARALGTYAHTATGSTYTLTHTWTASGTETINNEALFGAVNTTAGGVMPFESAEPNPPTLISGDTLQNTVTITIN